MDDATFTQYESTCSRILTTHSGEERRLAEEQVASFLASPADIPKAAAILARSTQPYALYITLHALSRILNNHWSTMDSQTRLDVRDFVVQFLRSPGGQTAPQIANAAYLLLARITKMGWLEHEQFRTTVDELLPLGAFRAVEAIVSEMNTVAPKKSLSHHRKIAVSFRDIALKKAFEAAVDALRTLPQNYLDALTLAHTCLLFDFVGIFPDDTADESSTLQLSPSWRPLIEEGNVLSVFFELYFRTQEKLALQCLVQLVGVRRSLFSSEPERKKFLSTVFGGLTFIMTNRIGIDDGDNRHEVCRVLARMKSSNFPLADLLQADGYTEWIRAVCQFTAETIADWEAHANSTYYLLSFLVRLITAQTHVRSSPLAADLPDLIPRIVHGYLLSRLQAIERALGPMNQMGQVGQMPDFLMDAELLHSQLESVPQLVRHLYDSLGPFLFSLFDPVLQAFQAQRNAVSAAQLAFLIYISAGVIALRGGGMMSSMSSNDPRDTFDADLSARVFQAAQLSVGYLAVPILERAILKFLTEFRTAFIGDASVATSVVFERLHVLCGINAQMPVMDMFLTRILGDLRDWAANQEIVSDALGFLQDLASSHGSTRRLLTKLPNVASLLANHASPELAFLNLPQNIRARSVYYCALGKLLGLDECTLSQFAEFMAPLDRAFSSLSSRDAIVGVLRDLRGVCSACSSKRAYERFWDWLYPSKLEVIFRAMEIFALDPVFTTAALRFLQELSVNRNQRIKFGPSSPNGILLFRELSRTIVAYASRIVLQTVRDVYAEKLKGMWLVFSVLVNSLKADYCNFGVFALYNDNALSSALTSAVQLLLSVSLEDMLSYRKVAFEYYSLLNVLCGDHCGALAGFGSDVVGHVLTSIQEGIRSTDGKIVVEACTALDNLCSFYVSETGKTSPVSAQLAQHFAAHPAALPSLLATLISVVVYEESPSYTLSRPMFALILMNPQWLDEARAQVGIRLGADRLETFNGACERLLQNVEMNLDARNRDQFSQNVTEFRQTMRKVL